MIPAIADTKAALSLSVYFEVTKRLLTEAIRDKDTALFRRCKLKMQDDDFEALPFDKQKELSALYKQAVKVCLGWGAV